MSVLNRPKIEAYVGGSGSGKGVSIVARLEELKPARLLVWDPRGEYAKHARAYYSLAALVKAFQKAAGSPIKARFVPGGNVNLQEAFDLVCKLAFNAGEIVFLGEELSDVTTASYAPPAWRQVITQGRHRALHVIGSVQRPALVDKSFLGNCTYIRCFTMRWDDDRRAMAKALDVPQALIDALETVEDEARGVTTINYVERDFRVSDKATALRTARIRLTR